MEPNESTITVKTLQECADIIAKHIFNQKSICIDDISGACVYFNKETGNKCAFGVLIPEEKYNKDFEQRSIDELCDEYENFLDSMGLPSDEEAIKFFNTAQCLHDSFWNLRNGKFEELCARNSLKYNPKD